MLEPLNRQGLFLPLAPPLSCRHWQHLTLLAMLL